MLRSGEDGEDCLSVGTAAVGGARVLRRNLFYLFALLTWDRSFLGQLLGCSKNELLELVSLCEDKMAQVTCRALGDAAMRGWLDDGEKVALMWSSEFERLEQIRIQFSTKVMSNWREVLRRTAQELSLMDLLRLVACDVGVEPTALTLDQDFAGPVDLLLSGEHAAGQSSLLVGLGVSHILCCYKAEKLHTKFEANNKVLSHALGFDGGGAVETGEAVDAFYHRLGIRRHREPMVDSEEYDLFPHFDPCVRWLLSAGKAGNTGRILIHCSAGFHRSAAIMVAYLLYAVYHTLKKLRTNSGGGGIPTLPPSSAVECVSRFVQNHRPGAEPISSAVKALQRWAEMLEESC